MNETTYLVDNNALLAIGSTRIKAEFFRRSCRITADVLAEAGSHPDRLILEGIVLDRTATLFELVRSVMHHEVRGNVELVDLYKNKGAADPGLLAVAIGELVAAEGTFFADVWILVTADKAVLERSEHFGLSTITPAQLAELIDSEESLPNR